MKMKKKVKRLAISLFACTVGALALVQAGCERESPADVSPTATIVTTSALPTAVKPNTAVPASAGARPPATNIPILDRVLDAVARGDGQALGDLLVVSPVACVKDPYGKIPVLECRAGEAEGTIHEVVLHGSCETGWADLADARALMNVYLRHDLKLYAVAESAADTGSYRAVFFETSGNRIGVAFNVSPEGIDSYGGGCGVASPPDLFLGWGKFIIPPTFDPLATSSLSVP